MIYGIIKLINFAHGDIYMLGAYFGFIATTMFGFSFIPAILFSMACAALAGIIIERVAYRPMRNAPRIAILITAIGVSFFLEYSMILIATPQPRTFPAVFWIFQNAAAHASRTRRHGSGQTAILDAYTCVWWLGTLRYPAAARVFFGAGIACG